MRRSGKHSVDGVDRLGKWVRDPRERDGGKHEAKCGGLPRVVPITTDNPCCTLFRGQQYDTHVTGMNVHKGSVSWGDVRGETLTHAVSIPSKSPYRFLVAALDTEVYSENKVSPVSIGSV